jgi:D-glycerate 3-kinase
MSEHGLPDRFSTLIEKHYSPLAEWLVKKRRSGETLLLGINGAQGSGKSTLADYLKLVLGIEYGWQVAVISIDDFYLTKAERNTLAREIHALLATRGVPGTHDVQLLADCMERLRALEPNNTMDLPRFDKALDDRADPDSWSMIAGPIDLIVLEGWCVGSIPQPDDMLMQAVNSLEEQEDASGDWRRYANMQLKGPYAELFAQLDALVFLQVPNFDAAYQWRLEQEEKLAESTGHHAAGIMSREQLARFMQHYERLTRANLAGLPAIADVILELDDNHDCVRSNYVLSGRPCIR